MATELPIEYMSRVAGADFTHDQYTYVTVDASGHVIPATLGANAIGVIVNTPGIGQTAQVMILGECMVYYGASVTAGQSVECDATGRAITATAGFVLGIALESGGVGELHTVLLSARGLLS
jgi:hypothetical protein